eukprot:m.78967 g.78967  ORF g.78967 m.78967 type:complete len:94 (-) comp11974_c0_seq5:848-1129(-)
MRESMPLRLTAKLSATSSRPTSSLKLATCTLASLSSVDFSDAITERRGAKTPFTSPTVLGKNATQQNKTKHIKKKKTETTHPFTHEYQRCVVA